MLRFLCVFALLCFVAEMACANETLHYLNQPECVRQEGTVGEGFLEKGEHSRIFFHFVNRTGKTLKFSLRTDKALINHKGALSASVEPGQAGAIATFKFLACKFSCTPSLIFLSAEVRANQTVSGEIEGTATERTYYSCTMGKGKSVPNMVVKSISCMSRNICVNAHMGTQKIRIATDNIDGIDGEYGTLIRLIIMNRTSKSLDVKSIVSPRGGGIIFPYILNNKVHTTHLITQKSYQVIFTKKINSGEYFILETIPVGGFNYPVDIIFDCH